MNSIGDKLRHQRLQRGITLDTVASETKIGTRMLEAIEAEEFDRLPGGVFRKSFVLQYARYLGVDEELILSDLKQRSGFDTAPSLPGEAELNGTHEDFGAEPEWRMPSLGKGGAGGYVGSLIGFVAVILGCAAVYTWWQKETHVAEIARQAPPAIKPDPAPVTPRATEQQNPPQGASQPPQATTPAPAPSAPAPLPQASTPTPAVQASGQPVRVNITAEEETWVQISSDGKRVFSNSLQANETKIVEAAEKVRVLVGNAGGLEVSLNGKPIGPIGPRGQVRVIELTPTGYLIVSPKPPKPESLPL